MEKNVCLSERQRESNKLINKLEVNVLREITQNQRPDQSHFATLIDSGTIEPGGHNFTVQRKLGPDLRRVMQNTRKKRFSPNTTLKIGIQLVQRFRELHEMGWLHLDLKPNNLVLSSGKISSPESSAVALIDFGISKSYLTPSLQHVKMEKDVRFAGNFLFASVNAFNNLTQSR